MVDRYDDEDEWGVLDKADLARSLDHWLDHINAEQLRSAVVELGHDPPGRLKDDLVNYAARQIRARRLSVADMLQHVPYTRIRLLAYVLGLDPRAPIPELRKNIAHETAERFLHSSSEGPRSR